MRHSYLLPLAAIALVLGACSSDVSQLEKTGSCPGCSLNRSTFQGSDLSRANLIDAQLNRAKLQAADLSESRLRNASLSRANLNYAILTRAQLQGADLSNATFKGADLRFADLSRANLTGADLREVDWGQNDLQETIADNLPLLKELLQEAVTEEANIEEFEEMSPQEMLELEGEELAKVLAITALVQGTDMASEHLQDALSSTPNLRNAIYDSSTRFPEGFDPESAQMRLVE